MRGVEKIPWLYDALCTVLEARGLKRWRAWLAAGAKGRTLEVGCGTGRNLPLYADAVALFAVEPEADALRRARRRRPEAMFVRASAHALPFRDGAFDTAVSSLVFCSVPDPATGLAELKRVLSTGGQLRMMEHVRSTSRAWGWWQDTSQPAWTWITGGCHNNRHTEEAVEAAGFAIEVSERRARGTMRRFVARANPLR